MGVEYKSPDLKDGDLDSSVMMNGKKVQALRD